VGRSQIESDDAFQPEDLVHEAYLKLTGGVVGERVANRQHYFAIAIRAMRRSLIDRSRAARAFKRFGQLERTELTSDIAGEGDYASESVWISDLLEKCAVKARFLMVADAPFGRNIGSRNRIHLRHLQSHGKKRPTSSNFSTEKVLQCYRSRQLMQAEAQPWKAGQILQIYWHVAETTLLWMRRVGSECFHWICPRCSMMRPPRANMPNGYFLGSYRIATAPEAELRPAHEPQVDTLR
jgi:hypothetical protein